MSALYPELGGKMVPADELMQWVFENHEHSNTPDSDPYVWSLPLERWLREAAR